MRPVRVKADERRPPYLNTIINHDREQVVLMRYALSCNVVWDWCKQAGIQPDALPADINKEWYSKATWWSQGEATKALQLPSAGCKCDPSHLHSL